MACERCNDSGWVCEAHDEHAWLIDGESHCKAPGIPCPDCNPSDGRGDPPDDSRLIADSEKAKPATNGRWSRTSCLMFLPRTT